MKKLITYSTYDMPTRSHSGRHTTHFTVTYTVRGGGYPQMSEIKEGSFKEQ